MCMRKMKFRRLKFVKEQILMTAAAQNIKRMIRLLSKKGPEKEALSAKQSSISFLICSLLKLFVSEEPNIKRIRFIYGLS